MPLRILGTLNFRSIYDSVIPERPVGGPGLQIIVGHAPSHGVCFVGLYRIMPSAILPKRIFSFLLEWKELTEWEGNARGVDLSEWLA